MARFRDASSLDSLLFAYNEGAKPEEIAERFPSLALPDIYAIIAYYLRNREELDAYLAQRNIQRSEFESRHEEPSLLDRLLERRNNRQHAALSLRLLTDPGSSVP